MTPLRLTCLLNDFLAPDAAPQNVAVSMVTSSSAMVAWDEVLDINLNGNLMIYEVNFFRLEGDPDIRRNTTQRSITVDDLEGNVEYNVSVRAYTAAGAGPYSDPPVQIMTLTGSKSSSKSLIRTQQLSEEVCKDSMKGLG